MSSIDENKSKCRTCSSVQVFSSVFALDEQIGVTPAVALMEVAHIEIKEDGKLPAHICLDCLEKLRNAMGFVRQAREVNRQWLSTHNCLLEAPIDMKEIKIENELCVGEHAHTAVFDVGPSLTVGVTEQHQEVTSENGRDPIAVAETQWSKPTKPMGTESGPENSESASPTKRRRGRPRLNKTEDKIDADEPQRFACEVCNKTFAWKKDLLRHTNSHFQTPGHECDTCGRQFLRKDKLKDHQKTHRKLANTDSEGQCDDVVRYNLRSSPAHGVGNYTSNSSDTYEDTSIKQKHAAHFECCLCAKRLENLSTLRVHLSGHADGSLSFNMAEGKFFRVYYATGSTATQAEIHRSIADDFALRNMTRFYLAFDESGNELHLDDSDTDQEQVASEAMLACELCGCQFKRRKTMLQHQQTEHLGATLPHGCPECHRGFVCEQLLQQHLNRDCLNRHKKHQCVSCTERFVWPENLARHTQLKHSDSVADEEDGQQKQRLQCHHCEKVFVWPKDLTRHLRVHMPDDEKFDCPYCERKFNRKDNMQSHVKVHGDKAYESVCKKKLNRTKQCSVKGIDENLCKPHGCKVIQCMICLSKHTKISDLRTHLIAHKQTLSFGQRLADESIDQISRQLYPENAPMTLANLTAIVCEDVSANRFDHLYSITNEMGYELSLNSSETDSDSDTETTVGPSANYCCGLCGSSYRRKYQVFEHQLLSHEWLEAKHVCGQCKQRFVSPLLLDHHQRQQCANTQKRFQCRKCPRRFMWRDNLQMHLRSTHAARSEVDPANRKPPQAQHTFNCEECERSFPMKKDLTRHMVMHRSDAAVFRCLWCPRRFYKLENLHMHVRRHDVMPEQLKAAECIIKATSNPHGSKVVLCKVCNLQFATVSQLRAHLLRESASSLSPHHNYPYTAYSITDALGFEMDLDDSATNDDEDVDDDGDVMQSRRQYTCVLCKLVCKRKYEMFQHQRSIHKHELLPLKCERCVFRAVSEQILEHHRRMHCFNESKQYACDECPFKFSWSENLEKHKKLDHAKEELAEQDYGKAAPHEQNSDGKVFSCDQCPRKYNRKDRLTAHMKKLHGPGALPKSLPQSRARPDVPAKEKIEAKQKFLCAFCGRAVTSSSNLIIHMRRHTGEKPFKCDFCDMAFPRSSDLQCHRRTHTGEKPHQCTVCQKAFSRSYKLQTHMRIHSGERPYKCTYCEKSFTQSNDLTLHIRRHTGERPYVCGVCGERFIQGTALKYHRIMHGHLEEAS